MSKRMRVLVLLGMFLLSAVGNAGAPAEAGRKEYVDKKNGFRLVLPASWKRTKSDNVLAGFVSPDGSLGVNVLRDPAALSAEEYLIAVEQLRSQTVRDYRKVSEEEAVLSGLPARKVVYRAAAERVQLRVWDVVLLARGDYWRLAVVGPDQALRSPAAAGYQTASEVLDSFRFSEPLLTKLKPMVQGQTNPPQLPALAGERYYINDRVGARILVPADWELVSEIQDPRGGAMTVVLGKENTLARIIVGREVLEGSPETYLQLFEKGLDQYEARPIGKEKVTRGGLLGTRWVLVLKEDNIPYRQWVEIFSAGREHFRIIASAPQEVFERYAGLFGRAIASVEFPSLQNRLPAEAPLPATPMPAKPGGAAEGPAGKAEGAGAAAADLERWKEAVSRDPGDLRARVELALALEKAGNLAGAIAELQAVVRMAPAVARFHSLLGIMHLENKDGKAAEAELNEALRLDPSDLLAQLQLARALAAGKNFDAALEHLKKLARLDRKLLLGDPLEEERRELDRARPDAAAHLSLALLIGFSDIERALAELQHAIRLDARFALAQEWLAKFYAGQGQTAESILSAYVAIQVNPKLPGAHLILARQYYAMALFPLAQERWSVFQRLGGKNSSWNEEMLSRIAAEAGSPPPNNLAVLTEQVKKNPGDARARMELGRVLALRGQYPAAEAEYRAALRIEPRLAEAYNELGVTEAAEGRLAEAILDWQEAVRINPELADAHLHLGWTWAQDEKSRAQALEQMEAFLRLADRQPIRGALAGETCFVAAQTYDRSGREKEAIEKYEAAVKADPGRSVLWNNTAWLYATAKNQALRDPRKALEYAKKAVGLDLNPDASHLDTLAEAYYVNGDAGKAVELEQKAIALRPNDEFLHEQLEKFEKTRQASAGQSSQASADQSRKEKQP